MERAGKAGSAAATSWDHVAGWYDKLVGDEGSDYHRHVVLPAAMRMLDPQPGERLLDLCCGQGVFSRQLAQLPVAEVLGVDASPALIAAARQRGGADKVRYVVADARHLGDLADARFDGAACLMAVPRADRIMVLIAVLLTGKMRVPRTYDCPVRIPSAAALTGYSAANGTSRSSAG